MTTLLHSTASVQSGRPTKGRKRKEDKGEALATNKPNPDRILTAAEKMVRYRMELAAKAAIMSQEMAALTVHDSGKGARDRAVNQEVDVVSKVTLICTRCFILLRYLIS